MGDERGGRGFVNTLPSFHIPALTVSLQVWFEGKFKTELEENVELMELEEMPWKGSSSGVPTANATPAPPTRIRLVSSSAREKTEANGGSSAVQSDDE